MDERLLDYIKSRQKKGVSRSRIRSDLIEAGYSSTSVDEVFFKISKKRIVRFLIFATLLVVALFFMIH